MKRQSDLLDLPKLDHHLAPNLRHDTLELGGFPLVLRDEFLAGELKYDEEGCAGGRYVHLGENVESSVLLKLGCGWEAKVGEEDLAAETTGAGPEGVDSLQDGLERTSIVSSY
jgi:hypothetical protein